MIERGDVDGFAGATVKPDRAGDFGRWFGEQPHRAHRGHALSRTAFTDQSDRFAGLHVQVCAEYGRNDTVDGRKFDLKVVYLE